MSFEERIESLRQNVRPVMEVAKKIVYEGQEGAASELEARLLAGGAPPDLFDELKSIVEFDPENLSGEQLAFVTRIAYELQLIGLGAGRGH